MTTAKVIARQLGRPTGILGWLAGFVWNRRNAALNNTVLTLLDLQPTDRVLDIGFGGGYLLNRMAALVTNGLLAGVDISPAIVAYGRKRYSGAVRVGKLDLRCAAAEALPYPPMHFTKVCSVNSIFYWQNAGQGIGEIERVLNPGGKVVLCFTCKTSIEKKGFSKNIQLYEPDTIVKLMTAQGFSDLQVTTSADQYRQYACVVGTKAC